jgi:16S rRNA (adenine1518-N6/adenine1519-N6)-dimethyltransferase
LGQHFLLHEPVLKRLASAACGDHTERMIEIGAGRGAFTKHLLPFVDELHVIEVDQTLVQHLQRRFAGEAKLTIHHADVLATDLTQWGPAVITGNLPYYITSPILEKFLKLDARFHSAMFLVQLEVARRLMAEPKTRDFGYLTVAAQLVANVELIARVDPRAFNPPPKVDSAAIRLVRRDDIPPDLDDILKFVSRCFTHKRKTLRNNLRPYYGVEADRHDAGFMRAEQLGVVGLVALYRRLSELVPNVP